MNSLGPFVEMTYWYPLAAKSQRWTLLAEIENSDWPSSEKETADIRGKGDSSFSIIWFQDLDLISQIRTLPWHKPRSIPSHLERMPMPALDVHCCNKPSSRYLTLYPKTDLNRFSRHRLVHGHQEKYTEHRLDLNSYASQTCYIFLWNLMDCLFWHRWWWSHTRHGWSSF